MKMKRGFLLISGRQAPRKIFLGLLAGCAVLLANCFLEAGVPCQVWAAPGPETASASIAAAPTPQRAARSGQVSKTAASVQHNAAQRARVVKSFGQLPLSFEPNRGQTDPAVKFLSRGRGYQLFLTPEGAVLSLKQSSAVSGQPSAEKLPRRNPRPESRIPAVVRMKLQGASRAGNLAGLEELPGKSNYFLGKDPSHWHANIPNYRKVVAHSIYPGVDLVYHGEQRELEFDFVVAPGVDPSNIRFGIETGNSGLETGNSKLENGRSAANPES